MSESWIHPNRRVLAVGWFAPIALFSGGIVAFVAGWTHGNWIWYGIATLLALTAVLLGAVLVWLMWQPRVGYRNGEVLVFCGLTAPVAVPLDVVECFFLGQAGGLIHDAHGREAEVRTVIIRLAEAAKDWHHREVQPALGQWCEGYITIRGTWCEPITPDLMKRLNQRLAELQRDRKRPQPETQL